MVKRVWPLLVEHAHQAIFGLPQISNRTHCPWRCYGDNSSSVVQNDDFLCAARLTDSIDKHLQQYATVSSSDCLCCCFVQPGIGFSWAPQNGSKN